MAHTPEEDIKVSARVCGRNKIINLKQVLNNITNLIGIESGGHNYAAGSIIPLEKEQEFIQSVLKTLG